MHKFRAARLRLTHETLCKLLRLPENAQVSAVFQDYDDMACRSVSFILHGVGSEMTEGGAVNLISLNELWESEQTDAVIINAWPDMAALGGLMTIGEVAAMMKDREAARK